MKVNSKHQTKHEFSLKSVTNQFAKLKTETAFINQILKIKKSHKATNCNQISKSRRKKTNDELGLPLVSEEDPIRENNEVEFAAADDEEVTARAIGE